MLYTPLARSLKLSPNSAIGSAQEESRASLKIRLFGNFETLIEGRPLPRLRSRKGALLFALLILRANREVSRDWLAAQIWPDNSEMQARQSLRQSLADLRAALGEQAYRLSTPTTQTLLFDAYGADVDVLRFDAILRAASPSLSLLEEAITLYRGALMEGSFESILMQEQDIRRQAFLEAVGAFAERALSRETGTKAIAFVKRGILEDPLRESLYRSLMQLYAEEGDFAAAVQTYRDLRARLQEELRASPASETVALYQTLLAKARAKLQQEPAPQEKPAEEKPVSQTSPALRATLPRPITGLIGREKEMEEIERLVCRNPLVTLLGMGGVGKTRLSVQIARNLAERGLETFEDGVFFVSLGPVDDSAFLLQTIANVLGASKAQGDLPNSLRAHLHSRSLLLVLDNCEHLIADCASVAETLLGYAAGLRILATSREPLGITGEICYRVQPLSFPSSDTSLESAEASPAVRLFVERGALVRPQFRLTPANAERIAVICRRLDGIPLALELAAARLKILSLEQIVARLEDRFSLLTDGNRTSPARHQTLRAMIDSSYDLLTEEERVLFRALSVFQGTFTFSAAEAICADEETLLLFSQLIDRSLIMAEESDFGERRYRLLESLREYAAERLAEEGETAHIETRFVNWAVEWLEETTKKLNSSNRVEWLKRIDGEYENLRKAIAIATPGELQGRLAVSLDRYWYMRSLAKEAENWLLLTMQGYDAMTEATQAQLQVSLGMAYWQKGDNASARKHLLIALPLARKFTKHLANAAIGLGLVEAADRNHALAVAYYSEALEASEQRNDLRVKATILSNTACVYLDQDDFDSARSFFYKSREAWQESGDRRGVYFEELFLALVEERTGNNDAAYAQYLPCLEQLRALEDYIGVAWGLAFLLYAQVKRKRYAYAAKITGALKGLRERLGVNANPTQEKAEAESREKTIAALGEETYLAAIEEACKWDIDATIAYIRSPEGA